MIGITVWAFSGDQLTLIAASGDNAAAGGVGAI
jgi:hypothetical protein